MTVEEIVRELAKLEAPTGQEPGTFTVPQIAGVWDCSQAKARQRVRLLMGAGAIEPATVTITNMWGAAQPVRGYRIKAA